MLSRFESVYFQELSDSITKFKTVTITDLPPEPEEISAVEAAQRRMGSNQSHQKFIPIRKGRDRNITPNEVYRSSPM